MSHHCEGWIAHPCNPSRKPRALDAAPISANKRPIPQEQIIFETQSTQYLKPSSSSPTTRGRAHQPANTIDRGPQGSRASGPPCDAVNGSTKDTALPNNRAIHLQPETKRISQEQLIAEIKGICAGLELIEGKCIEVDNAQQTAAPQQTVSARMSDGQWAALVSLYRTFLHEHHDFFLASQHPAGNISLRRLASKYAMAARMWRHGIHSFLELLRHSPALYDHMLTFIYTAYSMMALLYETVPAFEDTWIECLGDLAGYRMAIQEDDVKDREIWTGVSRHWYSLASEKAPSTGRLYHHLAIFARPNPIQQLHFYTKSLSVPIPFASARESIMTLFDPIFTSTPSRLSQIDTAFVKAHGILFSKKHTDQLDLTIEEYLSLLDGHIGRVTKRWLEIGYNTAIPLTCALLGYGATSAGSMRALYSQRSEVDEDREFDPDNRSDDEFEIALSLCRKTGETVWRRTVHHLHGILNTSLAITMHLCDLQCKILNRGMWLLSDFCDSIPAATRLLLPIIWASSALADTGKDEPSNTPSKYDPDMPRWIYPAIFAIIALYVEGAGRYYNERRKFYIIAMAPANLSFPWLVEHDGVCPILTGSVFFLAVHLGCAVALMDYEELRPSPMFYVVVTFLGLAISAMISTFCQSGSIAGLNASSGGNPFSIYLPFSMTLSVVVCGRLLAAFRAWIEEKKTSHARAVPYV